MMEKMSHRLETFMKRATICTEQKRTAGSNWGPRGGDRDLKLDRIDIGLDMHRQLGTLCWKRKNGRLRILLITSRETGRWVIPKGWPKQQVPDADMAMREAWEEAGVTGRMAPIAIGTFDYAKVITREPEIEVALPCRVEVFPMEVTDLARRFPEAKERKRGWFSPKKAATLVTERQLAQLIADFAPA